MDSNSNLLVGLIIILVLGVMIFSAANINPRTQIAVGSVALITLFILRHFNDNETVRIIFLLIAGFLSVDYFFWRTFYTLTFYDPLSFTFAMILYFAELYGFIVYGLSIFVNVEPLDRKPHPLPKDKSLWPSVDVMIPTYNEDVELLEITVLSALAIDYPADKLNVYLCDDGGTDQRCQSSDPDLAAKSRRRRAQLQELCKTSGAHYVTRKRNEHAKAGNINNGLQFSHGELILVLDADHVPTRDFLINTTGLFLVDPKLFLVQTPHFFTNPDPIEKNLDTFLRMPSENEMFYKVVQKGLDFWNSAFFCGSAAVLRRSHLREVGGIVGETITEDAETALTLHARGYNSAYIEKPMVSGLSPETLGGFIGQRIRWAQGMIQIFLLKNPLLIPGLTLPQRLCYFSSCFFWFFGYARLVFVVAPFAFLFFGLKIYDTNFFDFCAFALPHLITVFLVSDFLFGKVRWSFVSELYELIQSVYTLPAIFKVFLNPRAPKFNVTAKGETLDRDFVSPLAKPFYILIILTLFAIGFGVHRVIVFPLERFASSITLFWALFNLFILLGALGALLERRQRRSQARTSADYPATLRTEKHRFPGIVSDLSNGGAAMLVDRLAEPLLATGGKAVLEIQRQIPDPPLHLNVEIRNRRSRPDRLFVGVQFKPQDLEERKEIIGMVNGNSERWTSFQMSRENRIGVFGSFLFLLSYAIKHATAHIGHLLVSGGSSESSPAKREGERSPVER
jgi:cellulose synthase (UDP-forming)